MGVELLLLLIALLFIVGIALGLPIAFCLLGTAVTFFLFIKPSLVFLVYTSAYGAVTNELLLCLPLFVFMSCILNFSGIAGQVFDTVYRWAGGLKGSLLITTLLACALIAAMTGVSATGVITMSLMAYPQMEKYSYSKTLSLGSIVAGGALGPLIPPSTVMIVIGAFAQVSIAKLLIGGIVPGLIMTIMFCIYVGMSCYRRPELGPSLPPEMRATWKEKLISLSGLILPGFLIILVLGGIYSGAATPTEAAGVGSLGAIVGAAILRRLTWPNLKEAVFETMKISGMAFWMIIGGFAFSSLLNMAGITTLIAELTTLQVPPLFIVALMLIVILILGMFIDVISMTIICLPAFAQLTQALNIDLVWFCLLFAIAALIGYITPPFGVNLFYLKACLPDRDVTMGDIYSSTLPFVVLMLIVLVLGFVFPDILMWLPNKM